MRKITKWLCSVLLVAAIGLTGCGQKQKTESTAEKSNENHFVGEWIVEPEYAISKVGDENTLFVDGRGEKKAILGTVKGAIATVLQKENREMRNGGASRSRNSWKRLLAILELQRIKKLF